MFKNKYNTETHGIFGYLKWKLTSLNHSNNKTRFKITPKPWPASPESISFVNHSTFILKTNGMTILTDPIWSDCCSPIKNVGPQRLHSPGFQLESIKELEVILISHNHYDHLDADTLKYLINRFDPQVFVPKGDAKLIQDLGANNVKEFNWWESITIRDIDFSFCPAEHFSGRSPFDQNKSLWGSWLISSDEVNVYFAGDTGFSPHFKEIKDFSHRRIDVALLPIGAFKPRWYMRPVHMSPEDSVKAHIELKANQSIGMHFGTFQLADDCMMDSLAELELAKKNNKIPEKDFITMVPGHQKSLKAIKLFS